MCEWLRETIRYGIGLVILGAVTVAGCQQPASAPSPADSQSTREAEDEPNGAFVEATLVTLLADGSATLAGSIDQGSDVDVFDLGTMSAGDLLNVHVTRRSSSLQPAVAVYDGGGRLVNEDTLASVTDPFADPRIEHVVRQDSNHYFVAVSHNFVQDTTGQYEIAFRVERGGTVPEVRPQVVYLNFGGGATSNPFAGAVAIPPFDAADIREQYADDTALVKDSILETMRQNYKRYDVTLLDSDSDERPADGAYAEVFFGSFSALAFGVASEVDLYNSDFGGTVIVFTESFQPYVFIEAPSAEGLGVAIGNVAAHEVGHLLGLHHVRDPSDLMDEASPAFTLLFDQEFQLSPLSPQIFPLGFQDGADLLRVIVGDALSSSIRSSLGGTDAAGAGSGRGSVRSGSGRLLGRPVGATDLSQTVVEQEAAATDLLHLRYGGRSEPWLVVETAGGGLAVGKVAAGLAVDGETDASDALVPATDAAPVCKCLTCGIRRLTSFGPFQDPSKRSALRGT